jgi:predicted TIM-barrel fold metal-dependent hydrolase
MSEGKFLSTPTRYVTAAHWVACSISDMVFSGVFERHPGLRVVSLEHEVAWALHVVATMDYTYTQRARRAGWHRFPDATLPSDYFARNVVLCFQEDAVGLANREVLGSGTLVWGSDYPHQESTFPRSRQILDTILDGVPEEERRMILHDTPAALYGFAG